MISNQYTIFAKPENITRRKNRINNNIKTNGFRLLNTEKSEEPRFGTTLVIG
jgi:hypothetical protein